MPALTLDEQLIFDVAVALKKVKIPGFPHPPTILSM
jgi:hypothetical protein